MHFITDLNINLFTYVCYVGALWLFPVTLFCPTEQHKTTTIFIAVGATVIMEIMVCFLIYLQFQY